MCGIVGYVGDREASDILLDGLRRLEYRGYDSAGVAVLNGAGVHLRRRVGRLAVLKASLEQEPIKGYMGLGHTRWATHGRPCEENAHPHAGCDRRIMVVHNGIIENYLGLRKSLTEKGHRFSSQTDTEVLAHLIEEHYRHGLREAVCAALTYVEGSYAIGVLSGDNSGVLVAARKNSPLVLGMGKNETFLASDVAALLPYTRDIIFLEDGDLAELRKEEARVWNGEGRLVTRASQRIEWDEAMAEKNGSPHFMLKEIFEQRHTVAQTFSRRISSTGDRVELEDVLPPESARKIEKVSLIGCGTSYHAALAARIWFEEIARVPCSAEVASEYRYRRSSEGKGTLVVAMTQSGETADTLAALRDAKTKGLTTMAVCNTVGSSAARGADCTFYTRCGPEVSVASSKAFTGQLTALFLLTLYLAQFQEDVARPFLKSVLAELNRLPVLIQTVLDRAAAVEKVAREFYGRKNFLFLGRHLNFPIALEGALKLKEVSYIHAEGYPAGEMKHGPIALIDDTVPTVAIATSSSVEEKMLSNIQEVKARGGPVIVVASDGDSEAAKQGDFVLHVPPVDEFLAPILTIIPLQLLAYQIAVLRGCDVDRPRNLAKSVTVE